MHAVPASTTTGDAWATAPNDYLATRAPTCTVANPRSTYVAMPDGCRLAVDVYLPVSDRAGAATFATIVIFTPYYRRFRVVAGSAAEASPNCALYRDFFVPRGYALVVVDVRGTGASFGSRDSFRSPQERRDSYHVAEWIAAQPWSNGVIGATGISYLGAAADFLASTGHPAVKAIAPLFSVWDTYADNYFPGGIALTALQRHYDMFTIGLDRDMRERLKGYAQWAHPDLRGPSPVDGDPDGADLAAAIAQHAANFRQTEFMADIRVREEPLLHDPGFSSASISPYHYAGTVRPDVAVLSVSGWADGAGYANGAIARYLSLPDNPRYLLLGPWDHGGRVDISPWRSTEVPDKIFMAEALRFFDTHLMGIDTGLADEAPVHYYVLHAEQWRAAADWPPHDAVRTLHLAPTGLQPEADDTPGQLVHHVDFTHGTGQHTRYERIASLDPRIYYADWQGRTARMLSLDTAPFDAPVEIVGHVELGLDFASSEADAAIHAYLTEVFEDGREHHITEGLLRAVHRKVSQSPDNYRASWTFHSCRREDAMPLTPGDAVRIRVSMLPVAWRIDAGSRLRLSIAGADVDHCALIPAGRPPIFTIGTGTQPGGSTLELTVRAVGAATAAPISTTRSAPAGTSSSSIRVDVDMPRRHGSPVALAAREDSSATAK